MTAAPPPPAEHDQTKSILKILLSMRQDHPPPPPDCIIYFIIYKENRGPFGLSGSVFAIKQQKINNKQTKTYKTLAGYSDGIKDC